LRFFANFNGRLRAISRQDVRGFESGPLVASRWYTKQIVRGTAGKFGKNLAGRNSLAKLINIKGWVAEEVSFR